MKPPNFFHKQRRIKSFQVLKAHATQKGEKTNEMCEGYISVEIPCSTNNHWSKHHDPPLQDSFFVLLMKELKEIMIYTIRLDNEILPKIPSNR